MRKMLFITVIIFLVMVLLSVHTSNALKIDNLGDSQLSSNELVDNYDINNLILVDNNIIVVDDDEANNISIVTVNESIPFLDSWGYTGDV